MLHPSNVRDYIAIIRLSDDDRAEELLNEIAIFFYRLGLEDGERPKDS